MFLYFLSTQIFAQNPSQIDVLTTDDGLPFRSITCMTQDYNDVLWFGTEIGLIRYDGCDFKVYNSDKTNPLYIKDEQIGDNLEIDFKTKILWFFANSKLYSLDLSSDAVTAYGAAYGIKSSVMRLLKTSDGSIWIATDDFLTAKKGQAKQYLKKFIDGKFVVKAAIPRPQIAYSRLIETENNGVLWSTSQSSLKYDAHGNLLDTFHLSNYNWHGSEMNFTVSFYDHKNTHYFFPKKERGIFSLNETDLSVTQIFKSELQFYEAIEDHQGYVWFASNTELFRKDLDGNFTDYTAQLKSRLEYSKIMKLFIDKNNLLWVATDNGLFKIRTGDNLFTTLFASKNKGWGNTMRGIFEDSKGTIFAKCESQNQLFYKTIEGKIDTLHLNIDESVLEDSQYVSNFYVLDSKQKNAFTLGQSLLKINLENGDTKSYDQFRASITFKGQNPLIKLKNGKLLFGQSLSRLVLFDPETETSETVFKNKVLETDYADFRYFEESKTDGVVWIGTQSDGLLKIHLDGRLEKVYSKSTSPGISRNYILVIEEDLEGNLWIGTYGGGLNYISADGKTVKIYSTAEGLPNANVVGILADESKNNLWLSTYNGLSCFNKQTKIFRNFYAEDGLSHFEFNYSSFFKDSQGTFYFGGMNGLNSFKPKEPLRKSDAPTLRLTEISGYNSKNKSAFKTNYCQKEFKILEVSPYDQYFEIDWMMPSYFQNKKNTFNTTLQGFENRWFYQGNSTSIRYNQLPAGDYVLKVKGTDSRGNETASILSIPIHVKQIFYKRWWFITLAILALFGLIYSIFRYRLQQAIAMERLRTKISSDLHDDVGSLLSGLAMQTELLEANASDADKTRLHKIANISRNAVSQMRDLVWSIDSRRESIGDLIERMRELAEELLLPNDIAFKMDTSNIKNFDRKLLAQTKQDIFLIFKEAINNITRHSDADFVEINFTNNSNGCRIVIEVIMVAKKNLINHLDWACPI